MHPRLLRCVFRRDLLVCVWFSALWELLEVPSSTWDVMWVLGEPIIYKLGYLLCVVCYLWLMWCGPQSLFPNISWVQISELVMGNRHAHSIPQINTAGSRLFGGNGWEFTAWWFVTFLLGKQGTMEKHGEFSMVAVCFWVWPDFTSVLWMLKHFTKFFQPFHLLSLLPGALQGDDMMWRNKAQSFSQISQISSQSLQCKQVLFKLHIQSTFCLF